MTLAAKSYWTRKNPAVDEDLARMWRSEPCEVARQQPGTSVRGDGEDDRAQDATPRRGSVAAGHESMERSDHKLRTRLGRRVGSRRLGP
jgi:hypothetical protein